MSTRVTNDGGEPSDQRVAGPDVVPIPSAAELAARTDWRSWVLTDEDDEGESPEQGAIIRLLVDVLERWAEERGWDDVFIGADHFVGWIEPEPNVRVSPDVFVIFDAPGLTPDTAPASWQLWRPGHQTPRVAVEIVSEDWRKDYEENPLKYAQLGVEEYFVFDPAAARGEARSERVALQRFVRRGTRLVRTDAGSDPVYSEALEAWLVAANDGDGVRVRLARDADGIERVPTTAELRAIETERRIAETERRIAAEADAEREAARAEREAARAEREAARAEREAARADAEAAARQALEAELAALRAKLADTE